MHTSRQSTASGRYGHGQRGMGAAARASRAAKPGTGTGTGTGSGGAAAPGARRARSEGGTRSGSRGAVSRSGSRETDRPRGRSTSQTRQQPGASRHSMSPSSRSLNKSTSGLPLPLQSSTNITNISKRQNIVSKALSPRKFPAPASGHHPPASGVQGRGAAGAYASPSTFKAARGEHRESDSRHYNSSMNTSGMSGGGGPGAVKADPGAEFATTNQAAMRVMQRVKRLMNVLERNAQPDAQQRAPQGQAAASSAASVANTSVASSASRMPGPAGAGGPGGPNHSHGPGASSYYMSKSTAEIMKKYGAKVGGPGGARRPPVSDGDDADRAYKPHYSSLQQAVGERGRAPAQQQPAPPAAASSSGASSSAAKSAEAVSASEAAKEQLRIGRLGYAGYPMHQSTYTLSPAAYASTRGFSPPPRGQRDDGAGGRMPSTSSSPQQRTSLLNPSRTPTSSLTPRSAVDGVTAPAMSRVTFNLSSPGAKPAVAGRVAHERPRGPGRGGGGAPPQAEELLQKLSERIVKTSQQQQQKQHHHHHHHLQQHQQQLQQPLSHYAAKADPQPMPCSDETPEALRSPPAPHGEGDESVEKKLEYSAIDEPVDVSVLDLSTASRVGKEGSQEGAEPEAPPPPPPLPPPDTTAATATTTSPPASQQQHTPRVAWPVEPSPMRDEFMSLTSPYPLPSTSPPEEGGVYARYAASSVPRADSEDTAQPSESPDKDGMQAPAVSPSIAMSAREASRSGLEDDASLLPPSPPAMPGESVSQERPPQLSPVMAPRRSPPPAVAIKGTSPPVQPLSSPSAVSPPARRAGIVASSPSPPAVSPPSSPLRLREEGLLEAAAALTAPSPTSTSASTPPSSLSTQAAPAPITGKGSGRGDKRVFSPPPSPPQRGGGGGEHLLHTLLPGDPLKDEESNEAPPLSLDAPEVNGKSPEGSPKAEAAEGDEASPSNPKRSATVDASPAAQRAREEASWLTTAADLFPKTGLTPDAELSTISTVISSKLTAPQSNDLRQMIGDTVAQAVAVAKRRLDDKDRMAGFSLNRVPVRSLAAQMKQSLLGGANGFGQQRSPQQELQDEVKRVCGEWAEAKIRGDIFSEELAKKETQEAARSWRMSTPESRCRVVSSWADVVVAYLLHDTIDHFNRMEHLTQQRGLA